MVRVGKKLLIIKKEKDEKFVILVECCCFFPVKWRLKYFKLFLGFFEAQKKEIVENQNRAKNQSWRLLKHFRN